MLTSHQIAKALLSEPDLPVAYRGPDWAINLACEVTRVSRLAVGTKDSLVEPLQVILIEADPDQQLKEIPMTTTVSAPA